VVKSNVAELSINRLLKLYHPLVLMRALRNW
jgi:hypothetical protein